MKTYPGPFPGLEGNCGGTIHIHAAKHSYPPKRSGDTQYLSYNQPQTIFWTVQESVSWAQETNHAMGHATVSQYRRSLSSISAQTLVQFTSIHVALDTQVLRAQTKPPYSQIAVVKSSALQLPGCSSSTCTSQNKQKSRETQYALITDGDEIP